MALGLLSEPEAVSLVLGTAERAESPSAIAAAGKIAKMCGYLPLYVT